MSNSGIDRAKRMAKHDTKGLRKVLKKMNDEGTRLQFIPEGWSCNCGEYGKFTIKPSVVEGWYDVCYSSQTRSCYNGCSWEDLDNISNLNPDNSKDGSILNARCFSTFSECKAWAALALSKVKEVLDER